MQRREMTWVGWFIPQHGWCAFNTDSCYQGAGGTLRHYEGNWISGFSLRIGYCTSDEAELWGLIQGLRVAWEKGIRILGVEVDSTDVINWINVGNNMVRKHTSLIQGRA